MNQLKPQDISAGGQNMTSSVPNSTTHISSIKSAHSWVYPQSSLPPSVISALVLAATEGGMLAQTITFYLPFLFFCPHFLSFLFYFSLN